MTNFTHLITIFTNSTYTLFREVQETHANKLHNLGFAECCKELNEPNKVIINFSSYQLNDVEVAITESAYQKCYYQKCYYQKCAITKNACTICQQKGGKLHRVQFLETDSRILKAAELLPDKSFFIRMNTVLKFKGRCCE